MVEQESNVSDIGLLDQVPRKVRLCIAKSGFAYLGSGRKHRGAAFVRDCAAYVMICILSFLSGFTLRINTRDTCFISVAHINDYNY